MQMPAIQGLIRRRLLVNFRVDPDVIQRQLPAPFRPKLLDDAAVAGVCLIRLEQLRSHFLPPGLGLTSENAAHRVAVVWHDESGQVQEGVYIPRRDSNSLINRIVGGRLFPGEHEPATFTITDTDDAINLAMRSNDGAVTIVVRARTADALPRSSCFPSLEAASTFFAAGAAGYSPRRNSQSLDGLWLNIPNWQVIPLEVEEVRSSFFADKRAFPPGSVEFDCALLIGNQLHDWQTLPALCPY